MNSSCPLLARSDGNEPAHLALMEISSIAKIDLVGDLLSLELTSRAYHRPCPGSIHAAARLSLSPMTLQQALYSS
jgi:hypothetical protein